MQSSLFQRIIQIQTSFQMDLMARRNVVGVAVGFKETEGIITDTPAVVVLVEQKKPLAALSVDEMIPREVGGVRTDVYEVGFLQAQQTPRDRYRPTIPGGVSIGHYKVTAGTLGAMVRDRTTGERFILSNNHVLANSNEALVGDAVLQPAATDQGRDPGDVVARLERFITLHYLEGPVGTPTPGPGPGPTPGPVDPTRPPGCDIADVLVGASNFLARLAGSEKRLQATSAQAVGEESLAARTEAQQAVITNTVDCALARPLSDAMFGSEILNIGQVSGTKNPALGMRVRKSGRTTGYTEGNITLINATVNVSYNTSVGTRTARFTGQIITEAMSQGGDSGSLVVDTTENKAVGLLFAGSPVATIFTPMNLVLSALNITI